MDYRGRQRMAVRLLRLRARTIADSCLIRDYSISPSRVRWIVSRERDRFKHISKFGDHSRRVISSSFRERIELSPFFLGRYTWSFETVSSSSSSVRLLLEPRDSVALLNFSMSFSPDYRVLLSVSSFLFPVQLVKRAKRNSPLFDGYPIKHRKLMPGISRASDVFQQGKK